MDRSILYPLLWRSCLSLWADNSVPAVTPTPLALRGLRQCPGDTTSERTLTLTIRHRTCSRGTRVAADVDEDSCHDAMTPPQRSATDGTVFGVYARAVE